MTVLSEASAAAATAGAAARRGGGSAGSSARCTSIPAMSLRRHTFIRTTQGRGLEGVVACINTGGQGVFDPRIDL